MLKPEELTPEIKLQAWGQGPWVDEPNLVEFTHCGIACIINRIASPEGQTKEFIFGGHLCGYCILPAGHKHIGSSLYMLNYDVHGNITYAEETELGYMIGFDCAHCWDIVPSIHKIVPNRKSSFFEQTYKTVDFVTEQCKKLAEQIAKDDAKKFERLKIEEV